MKQVLVSVGFSEELLKTIKNKLVMTGLIHCCLFFSATTHIDTSICQENKNIFLLCSLAFLRTSSFEKDLQPPWPLLWWSEDFEGCTRCWSGGSRSVRVLETFWKNDSGRILAENMAQARSQSVVFYSVKTGKMSLLVLVLAVSKTKKLYICVSQQDL